MQTRLHFSAIKPLAETDEEAKAELIELTAKRKDKCEKIADVGVLRRHILYYVAVVPSSLRGDGSRCCAVVRND